MRLIGIGCAEFEVERAVSLDQALARPAGFEGPGFAAVLYKPAAPDALLALLRGLTSGGADGAAAAAAADPFDAGQVGPAGHL